MSSSEFHERLKSKDLRDFRLGTVATSDHETPLTAKIRGGQEEERKSHEDRPKHVEPSCGRFIPECVVSDPV